MTPTKCYASQTYVSLDTEYKFFEKFVLRCRMCQKGLVARFQVHDPDKQSAFCAVGHDIRGRRHADGGHA